MRLCTLLPLLLAACGIPDDASPNAPTSSTGDSSSSSSDSSSSSSSSDSTSNAEDSSSGESDTPEDTSGSGGGGGSTGELSCGEVECDAPRFCMTHPQTGKRLCVEACTAAATCLVASEECITVAGLSTCFPALCDVLADCPDGSVECVNDFCH